MELGNLYESVDAKYSPILGYLSISPLEEIKELLVSIHEKEGIMRDYFGFDYEENNTLTFYDFTSVQEKSINVSIKELMDFLNPILINYLSKFNDEFFFVEDILKKILEQ